MIFSFKLRLSLSIIVCLSFSVSLLNGQTYSFINYGTERNNGFVYTLNQSDDGFLWVGTADGLTRFDGYNFYPVQFPDTAVGRYPTKSLKDKNGRLWFGCSDGAVLYVKDNRLIPVHLLNSKSISEIIEGPDELIYVIPQGGGVYSINAVKPEETHLYSSAVEPVINAAAFTSSGDLLVGTQESLMICRFSKDSLSVTRIIDGLENSIVTALLKTDDPKKFIVGTDDQGLFILNLSDNVNELKHFPDHPELRSIYVQSVYKDSEKSFWVSTVGFGGIQINLTDDFEEVKSTRYYNISSGLIANDVKTIFQDIEGNYWFGLYGQGISILTSYSLDYFSPGKNAEENNILYVGNYDNNYLLGTPSGFHIFDPVAGHSLSFTDLKKLVGNVEIKSFSLDKEKNLWIGTGGNGLFIRNSKGVVKRVYRSGDTGADDIRDIQIDDRNVWLATTNGVIVLDKNGNTKMQFNIDSGLPHNSINKLFLSREGNAYIGTESDKLFKIDKEFKITSGTASMSGSTRNKILSFAQSYDGAIWVATEGNGVFRFLHDSISSVNRTDDLLSNYCYSILADNENNIWIGHNKGFSRFNPKTGSIRIFGTDFPKGGVCNPDAIFESADKKIFIGSTEGLIIYDLSKERKSTVPPLNNINIVEINDVPYPYQPSFVLPYKKYKIKVYYSGINFSTPQKIYYSTFLENFDLDWSKMTTSRDATYNLGDGKYKFSLVSVNEENFTQGAPVSFSILIKKPFYRTWWFILCAIIVFTGIIILIIRERDKSQKKIQEYLEKELEARTRVVVKQKGEIELQNIEITDSINYAKRIQTSILPDINKLKDTFRDAFIFFHPRDIVSGDFYWFDKLDDDKFILVCADSTGHGVPGAFMSMIGSTLLQDIVTRKKISKPSEILSLLDKQIFSTLNQNVELGVSNDGMDMVVCEFNITTRHFRFASAMRPVILVLDGESFYIKGNRSSVGGESVMEKFFDDQEYYLKEGDTIYLFSDGMPDQFGGPEGKKMKINRLKGMIEKTVNLPMEEQKAAMSKFYFDWKGSYDQVDDVLMMGVKV
jgi:ligand-binding sensor domain-containing protein/serine phosphatase RsbU (regulator of sigma subunit)